LDVRLRGATDADAAALLAIRNHPNVRPYGWSTRVIHRDEHRRWLKTKLDDPDVRLYVIDINGQPAGLLRLDRRGPDAEVSLALLPKHRGRGAGREAIRAARRLADEELGAKEVVAEIRPENQASLGAFAAAGFTEVSRNAAKVVMRAPVIRHA
jgi:RimJ/RimL family protein N-acetyltransferase